MTDWKALIGMIEMIEKVDKEGEDYKEDSYNSIDKLHSTADDDKR